MTIWCNAMVPAIISRAEKLSVAPHVPSESGVDCRKRSTARKKEGVLGGSSSKVKGRRELPGLLPRALAASSIYETRGCSCAARNLPSQPSTGFNRLQASV